MAKSVVAKHKVPKRRLKGHVSTKDHQWFEVGRVGRTEERVLLDFGREVPFRVVKLSVAGLPASSKGGKKIKWVTNFAVMHRSGKYVGRVSYALYLKGQRGKTFVYYDQGGLKYNKKPLPAKNKRVPRGWVKVVFRTGDPAAGWG